MDFINGVVALKRIALATAYAAFLIAGWVALQTSMQALAEGLLAAIPSSIEAPLSLAFFLLPANTSACVTALVLAYIARWLWEVQKHWAESFTRA